MVLCAATLARYYFLITARDVGVTRVRYKTRRHRTATIIIIIIGARACGNGPASRRRGVYYIVVVCSRVHAVKRMSTRWCILALLLSLIPSTSPLPPGTRAYELTIIRAHSAR